MTVDQEFATSQTIDKKQCKLNLRNVAYYGNQDVNISRIVDLCNAGPQVSRVKEFTTFFGETQLFDKLNFL